MNDEPVSQTEDLTSEQRLGRIRGVIRKIRSSGNTEEARTLGGLFEEASSSHPGDSDGLETKFLHSVGELLPRSYAEDIAVELGRPDDLASQKTASDSLTAEEHLSRIKGVIRELQGSEENRDNKQLQELLRETKNGVL